MAVAPRDGVDDVAVDARDVESATVVLHRRQRSPSVRLHVVNFDQIETLAAIVTACEVQKGSFIRDVARLINAHDVIGIQSNLPKV